jgi:hypothetical protein
LTEDEESTTTTISKSGKGGQSSVSNLVSLMQQGLLG